MDSIQVTFEFSKFDKFRDVKDLQLENIESIFFIFEVIKLDKSMDNNELHLLNIEPIFIRFGEGESGNMIVCKEESKQNIVVKIVICVRSKLDKLREVNLLHPWNIPWTFVSCGVLKWDKLIEINDPQL